MANNNRRSVAYSSKMDIAKKAREQSVSSKKVMQDKIRATKEDIQNSLEIMYGENQYLVDSDFIIMNAGQKVWDKKSAKGNIGPISEKLKELNKISFHDAIANNYQSGKSLMLKTLEFNTNINVKHTNQRGSAVESIGSWNESYNHFVTNVQGKNGKLFLWDLETTGGKDNTGIWRPNSITEFSMQEYDFATKSLENTTVLVGANKEKTNNIVARIEKAIANGTLESDEELKVTAMRLSLYDPENGFGYEKTKKGYFKATKFGDADNHRMKDIDSIRRGADVLIKVGQETSTIDGISADKYHIGKAINNMQEELAKGNSSLVGYNSNLFDSPILNSQLLEWQKESAAFGALFKNGTASLNVPSKYEMDLFGAVKQYTETNSISSLFGGMDISDVKKIRGQEDLIKAHYANWFKSQGLRPHMAEDDTKALIALITQNSEILEDKTFLEHINAGIQKPWYTSDLTANKQVLRAKKQMGATNDGKGYLNFAMSKKGTVFTKDNHMLGTGDLALDAAGGMLKEGFNTGYGVNKGAFYDIKNIQQVTLDNKTRELIGSIAPEYSGDTLYHVQLGMVVDDAYENTRLGDLTQNLFFKSEKEMMATLSSNFDVIAERSENGIEVVKGFRSSLDRRQINKKYSKADFTDIHNNKNKSNAELFYEEVKFNNKKLLTSRSENNMLQDKSLKKIQQALDLEESLEKVLGFKAKDYQMNAIMAGKVAAGQMPIELSNSQIMSAQEIIFEALSYDKNNTKRILDSSIDNMSTGMGMVSTHRTMLTNVLTALNENKKFSNKNTSYEAKQEMFSRTLKEVRRTVAEHIYNNSDNAAVRMATGNAKLEMSYKQFANTYEIDYSSLIKGDRVNYIDLSNSADNILKLDLSNSNDSYKLINTAVNSMYGSNTDISDKHKQVAMENMYNHLNKNKQLRRTKAFKGVRNKDGSLKKNFHQDELAQIIMTGMKQVKKTDARNGIINIEKAFMKSLDGNPAFTKALNSDLVADLIPDIANNIVNSLDYRKMNGTEASARALAANLIKKHYMPDIKEVSNTPGWNKSKDILFKNATNDLTEKMTDIIYSVGKIDGTKMSVQEDGTLLISRNGRYEVLNNIPKVKFNKDSGTMYTEVGSMKIQINNELVIDENLKGRTASSLRSLNKYKSSNNVQKIYELHGADEAMDRILYDLRNSLKGIRQGSTINGFGGSDVDSNNNVSIEDIKNVLPALFSKNGKRRDLVDGIDFMDRNLVEALQQEFKVAFNKGESIDSLSPTAIRHLVKNNKHILDIINGVGQVDDDFKYLTKNFSMSTSEKKIGMMIGTSEARSGNYVMSLFDNNQKPTITQAGNAKPLSVERIKSGHPDISAGNVLSSAMTDKKAMRTYAGIGSTTTDVMMNISYFDSNALKVIMDSNFNKVINNAKAEFPSQQATENAHNYTHNSVSVFEQERLIDSRIYESINGLMTASTQKFSRNNDLISIVNGLEGKDYNKQVKALIAKRGTFDNEFKYTSAVGTYMKKGEAAIKWKGFGGLDTVFGSKMNEGVFNYNYYNASGMKLGDDAINNIISEHKSMFKSGSSHAEMNKTLDTILAKFDIKGQFAIEDIAAMGYDKTMTGSEKAMTDIIYNPTGSYDNNVKKFWQNINKWDNVKSRVITNEAVDALIEDSSKQVSVKTALKGTGFKNIAELKTAMASERHLHSSLLFSHALSGKASMIANDAIVKHGNSGQQYQGMLGKAINSLTKQSGSQQTAVQTIADLIANNESMQFAQNMNLSKGVIAKSIGIENVNGVLTFKSDFLTGIDNISTLNQEKFTTLIRAIDSKLEGMDSSDRLIARNVYSMSLDKDNNPIYNHHEELIGSYSTVEKQIKDSTGKLINANVVIGTNTRENVKQVRDPETQTGVGADYFQLKKSELELKKRKISLDDQLNRASTKEERSAISKQLIQVKAELNIVKDDVATYDGVVKLMKFGDQELSIVERIAITDSHADRMQELMNSGSINPNTISTPSLSGAVKVNSDGQLTWGNDAIGERSLSGLTKRLKDTQFYNRFDEELLTANDIGTKEYSHLKGFYDYANKHNTPMGRDTAQKMFDIKTAKLADDFNDSIIGLDKLAHSGDGPIEQGKFKIKAIKDFHFGADDIVTENVIADLGKEFGSDQYFAMPGIGMKVADEEIGLEVHNKFRSLKNRYDDYKDYQGEISEASELAKQKVIEAKKEASKALERGIYGKHGLDHRASTLEIDAVSYRLKASGIITDTSNQDFVKLAKANGLSVTGNDSSITQKAMIDGRSIADWEKNGEAYYDYKFVSREQMDNMGYFKKDQLDKFGFDNVEQMEEHLKTYGTYDITDRYPNTRTGSINSTRVFMDDKLQGNQTKVSISTILKANADHDGDSYSSFLIDMYDKDDNRYDGSLFERVNQLAKENNRDGREFGQSTGMMPNEIYDTFNNIQRVNTVNALTTNKDWQNKGTETILKDMTKHTKSHMVMVPGGQSVLGQNAFTALSELPSLQEFNRIEDEANKIIQSATSMFGKGINEVNGIKKEDLISGVTSDGVNLPKVVRDGDSAQMLNDALTVLKDNIDGDQFNQWEAIAIKKANIDKFGQEMMAKTGLPATGSVNVSMNAIKLASQFTEPDTNATKFTNLIWNTLDVAEEGVISSKHLKGGIYDDSRISDFQQAIKGIFRPNQVASNKSVEALGSWFDVHGGSVFEDAFNSMGKDILSPDTYNKINGMDEAERVTAGAAEMRKVFLDKIEYMSNDEKTKSYMSSVEANGRNGNVKALWRNGSLGIAAADGNTLASRYQGLMGAGDEGLRDSVAKEAVERNYIRAQQQEGKERLKSMGTAKQARVVADTVVSSSSGAMGAIGNMGMAAIGVGVGLMVGGYASGNPLNDKSAEQVNNEMVQPKQTMSIPEFMDKDSGYVTGNTQQGYIINIKADTKKGKKHMQRIMAKAAEATVGGSVSVNMNIKNGNDKGVTNADVENFLNSQF